MKYGFLKVAAASPELRVADVAFNAEKIVEEMQTQAKAGVEVLVFPELCLCGYTVADLVLQPLLVEKCKEFALWIAERTKHIKTLTFIGLPVVKDGQLYNCALALCEGQLLGLTPKSNIPNYGAFYERRYFCPAPSGVSFIAFGDNKVPFGTELLFRAKTQSDAVIACEICEDLWVGNSPSVAHANAGATVIVNLSASYEIIGKAEYRRTLVQAQSGKNTCAYVYAAAGAGESTSEVVFAGHNLIAENGELLAQNTLFSGETVVAEVDVGFIASERRKNTFSSAKSENYTEIVADFCGDGELSLRKVSVLPFIPEDNEYERVELVLSLQANALARRFKHTGAKTAVIGVSGGLDSTLALLATARAFKTIGKDAKDIIGVTMPGFGTSGRTYENACALVRLLGATLREVSIKDSVTQHFKDIGHDINVHDVTYENAQARMRTLVLMDIANQTGGLVIGTGDMSELALGWCTYNGDHASMYGLNASVPKTLVKFIVAKKAQSEEGELGLVLKEIAEREISPELLPPTQNGEIAQKTEDLVGPYELHDFFLYHTLRRGCEPKKTYALALYAFQGTYTKETIKKWLTVFYRRFFSQQFKRSASPDGVKIGTVSLSAKGDFRMPSDACATVWLSEIEKL